MHTFSHRVNYKIALRIKSLSILSLVLFLSACANKVTVVSNIPTPLVTKVPLNVNMSYTDEFKEYVYVESEKKRALSSLNFADAQINMFDSIFSGLATIVDPATGAHDLTVEPEVLDFQYTAPSETKLKQYEIWIKYRIKLLNTDDSKLADWTIKGYGKTPTALLTSASKAFNSAANVALRDVGAQLATRFAGQRKIRDLIASKASAEPFEAPLLETPVSETSLFKAPLASSGTVEIEETVAPADELVTASEAANASVATDIDLDEEPSDE